jgi:1,4-alpha-glucan branching enzyme
VKLVTDPLAGSVDWRLLAPPAPGDAGDRAAAAVVMVRDGVLVPCDPDGGLPDWSGDAPLAGLRPNNRTVIYELPVQWTRAVEEGGAETAVGTFRDALALVEPAAEAPGFPGVPALAPGRAHLAELGISTLELLPIADSVLVRGWKYGTTNYLAPDHTLGLPAGADAPAAGAGLARLVTACHRAGVRVFLDAVMGFGRQDAMRHVDFPGFHVRWRPEGDPDRDPEQADRQGWGGDLWKYAWATTAYDPVAGGSAELFPARRLMMAVAARWVLEQRMDGIRMDSVDTVHNWDFVGEFRACARELFLARARAQGMPDGDAQARFLVVGEELHMPRGLVRERLDALWNDEFKYAARAAILGRVCDGDPDFEHTVRKVVDARLVCDFRDGAEAVNYLTSHDVGNWGGERLYDHLRANGVVDCERRIKLAFAVLLTAVGIPMILAGEEFADQQDLPLAEKETDPVDFSRLDDPWRRRIFDQVARLVRLRHDAEALAVNDTEFIHIDLTPGRRVVAWRRGGPGMDPVVVVANFSDWGTADPDAPGAEYVVPGWPATPPGRRWREVTQDRDVPGDWIGREPLYPWEAKVYALAPTG